MILHGRLGTSGSGEVKDWGGRAHTRSKYMCACFVVYVLKYGCVFTDLFAFFVGNYLILISFELKFQIS